MQSYWAEVKLGVLMSQGISDPSELTRRTTHDKHIMRLAFRVLPAAERDSFYFAYGCVESWEKIEEIHAEHLKRPIDLETIKKYAANTRRIIFENATDAPELAPLRGDSQGSTDPSSKGPPPSSKPKTRK